jgi:hypothetical protein
MTKNFSKNELDTFTQESWNLKRRLGIKYTAAQDVIANSHGYSNWSLLKREFNGQHPEVRLLNALQEYVKKLGDNEIERLFLSGTVWVSLSDFERGKVDIDSFQCLGQRFDGTTVQRSHGLGLIVDMDGMPDAYKLETEEVSVYDEYDHDWPVLTIKEARKVILDTLEREVEVRLDSIIIEINNK